MSKKNSRLSQKLLRKKQKKQHKQHKKEKLIFKKTRQKYNAHVKTALYKDSYRKVSELMETQELISADNYMNSGRKSAELTVEKKTPQEPIYVLDTVNYSAKSKPTIQMWKHEDGEMHAYIPFKYSYDFQRKFKADGDFNELRQKQYYDMFVKANEKIKEIRDITGLDIGMNIGLSFDNISFSQLKNRWEKAKQVLSGTYLSTIASEYKTATLENFKPHLSDVMYYDLVSAINNISDYQFLQLIKNLKLDSLPFILDSIITAGGIRIINDNAQILIDTARSGRGEFYS